MQIMPLSPSQSHYMALMLGRCGWKIVAAITASAMGGPLRIRKLGKIPSRLCSVSFSSLDARLRFKQYQVEMVTSLDTERDRIVAATDCSLAVSLHDYSANRQTQTHSLRLYCWRSDEQRGAITLRNLLGKLRMSTNLTSLRPRSACRVCEHPNAAPPYSSLHWGVI